MQVSQQLMMTCFLLAMALGSLASDDKKENKKKKLQIGVKKRVEADKCPIKSRKGDTLQMHYTVSELHACNNLLWLI